MTTHEKGPPTPKMRRIEAALREAGFAYPEVQEDFPWGHRALKVNGKGFVYMNADEEGLSLSLKLPASHTIALRQPFAEPTRYGLGKSGWVTATFGADDDPPVDLLRAWIDESYRAIAPKRCLASLGGSGRRGGVTSKIKKRSSVKTKR